MNERELIEGFHNSISRYVDLLIDCGHKNNDVNKLIAAIEWDKIDRILYTMLMDGPNKAFNIMEKECEKLEKELRCAAQESQPENTN